MALITKIGVHNTGGIGNKPFASSQHLTAENVNEAHRTRTEWIGYHAHKSELGFYGGYNFFIDKGGKLTQFRLIGEETLAARNSNFDTVHFCLAGNFTKGVDTPTPAQILTLRLAIEKLESGVFSDAFKVKRGTSWAFSRERVFPHRVLQPTTSCYGDSLSDDWARNIFNQVNEVAEKKKLLAQIKDLKEALRRLLRKRRVGSSLKSCHESDVLG
jgi:hypothetical protein